MTASSHRQKLSPQESRVLWARGNGLPFKAVFEAEHPYLQKLHAVGISENGSAISGGSDGGGDGRAQVHDPDGADRDSDHAHQRKIQGTNSKAQG
jgi:hypothetical protein